MNKIKLWSVTVNYTSWNRPRIYYFTSRQAAERCGADFEYSDKPKYCGMFSENSVLPAIHFNDISEFDIPIKHLYYNSYTEWKNND